MKWIWSQSRYAATISCLGKKKLNRAQSFLCPIKICVSEPYAQQKHFIVGNWHTLRDRTSHTTPSTFMFNVNYGGKWILLRCELKNFFCLFVCSWVLAAFIRSLKRIIHNRWKATTCMENDNHATISIVQFIYFWAVQFIPFWVKNTFDCYVTVCWMLITYWNRIIAFRSRIYIA